MSLKLAARLVALEPTKIADLQENDTAIHVLDLSSIVPPECMAILVRAQRMGGSGLFTIYPMSGSTITITSDHISSALIPIKNQELTWKNTVANDDWDVILFGYFVQKRTR